MGSKPITAIAKMKSYENTVAKKIGDPTDPPKSITEDVQDDNGYLQQGGVSFSFGQDKVSIDRKEKMRNLTDADVWNTNRNNVQGDYPDFKSYQTAAQTFRDQQGESFTPAQIGTGQFTETVNRKPGDILASFAYKPQTREADTFEIREARKRDRNIKRSGRVMNRDLKKYGKDSEEYKSSKAAYDRYLRERTEGVNPYNTARSKENIKAPEGTQTKSEFENKFGDGNMGVHQIKSTTADSIKFHNPTMPSSSSTISDFSGSGSYLNRGPQPTNEQQLQNFFSLKNNPPAIGTKRGYKMGGYGTKNK